MKFKLLYFGEIFSNPKKRAQHIADIRMQFHPQLKKLLEHSPWDHLSQYMMPGATKSPITTKHIGGIDWNPIITPNLKLIAELDIQMLHPEIVGVARTDVDNRIKTVLDGLRCPQNEHEIGENTPKNIGPIYTLLDDDHLVTKMSVNTSHLLSKHIFPDDPHKLNDPIFMMIDVNVRVVEGNLENLPFMV
ncbi:MAG: hypothetical protein JW974_02295 [Alphaproteobacteria bacterium]|nr:hypothetical protein [Alphaproteobacteria bacterium]MBN2674947.1 hypothetical protein [Alphaproteobacteria bacterium]